MTNELSLEAVQALVTRIAGPSQSPSNAGPDTPLLEGGFGLDSVHLLDAIIACEREYGVVFEPRTDFTAEALRTVRSLYHLIHAKRTH